MSWIAAAIGGSAALNFLSADKSADAQSQAAGNAVAEEARQFDLQWDAQAPYREGGYNALGNMAVLTGSPDPRIQTYNDSIQAAVDSFRQEIATPESYGFGDLAGTPTGPASDDIAAIFGTNNVDKITDEQILSFLGNPDAMSDDMLQKYSSYTQEISGLQSDINSLSTTGMTAEELVRQDPSYDFRLEEGQGALENYMSGGGGRWSGNAMRAITDYGQNYASTEYNNMFNRNATIAGYGPAATQTPSNDISAYMADQGNVAANQYTNQANAINQGITNWVSYDQNQQMMNALGQPTVTTDYGIPMQSTEYIY